MTVVNIEIDHVYGMQNSLQQHSQTPQFLVYVFRYTNTRNIYIYMSRVNTPNMHQVRHKDVLQLIEAEACMRQ